MSEFSLTIKEKLNEFKSTYRRELPRHLKEDLELEKLEIKRRSIQSYSDISLYHKTYELIKHLEEKQGDNTSKLYEHQGLEKFIDQIKYILDDYTQYEESIVHKNKYSCEALIRAIQIITLKKISLNYEYYIKLKNCCRIIIDLDNNIHIEKLTFAIKTNYRSNPIFFDKILNYCKSISK